MPTHKKENRCPHDTSWTVVSSVAVVMRKGNRSMDKNPGPQQKPRQESGKTSSVGSVV
jgi:hypothetical protein